MDKLFDQMREAMREFCDRVDRGEIRSKTTYAKFKNLLAQVQPSRQWIHDGDVPLLEQLQRMSEDESTYRAFIAQPVPAAQDADDRTDWNAKQWYEHVGAWETAEGHISFGSIMAVRAMLIQFGRSLRPVPEPVFWLSNIGEDNAPDYIVCGKDSHGSILELLNAFPVYTSPIPPALLPQIVEALEKNAQLCAPLVEDGWPIRIKDARKALELSRAAIAALKQIGGLVAENERLRKDAETASCRSVGADIKRNTL